MAVYAVYPYKCADILPVEISRNCIITGYTNFLSHMSDAIVTALIAGIVGVITGAIGSLFAPWAQWGIEKRRKKLERRGALVDAWRKLLSSPEFKRGMMLNDPNYGALRPLLVDEVRKRIERPSNHIIAVQNGATDSPDRDALLREVARIEQTWGLL
jgi:hypothetical protein